MVPGIQKTQKSYQAGKVELKSFYLRDRFHEILKTIQAFLNITVKLSPVHIVPGDHLGPGLYLFAMFQKFYEVPPAFIHKPVGIMIDSHASRVETLMRLLPLANKLRTHKTHFFLLFAFQEQFIRMAFFIITQKIIRGGRKNETLRFFFGRFDPIGVVFPGQLPITFFNLLSTCIILQTKQVVKIIGF